VDIFMDV